MNKQGLRLMMAVLVLMGVQSCQEDDIFLPVEKERTYLHFLNAYAGVRSVDVTFETNGENKNVASDVRFSNSWPNSGYASLLTTPDTLAGQGGVFIRVWDHDTEEEIVPGIYKNLGAEGIFTFVLVDSFSKPVVVKALDNLEEDITAGTQLRLMNLNRFVQSVSLVDEVGQEYIRGLNFLNYSTFRNVATGKQSFYFINDLSGAVLDSLNLDIRNGKIYSFYLTHNNGNPVGGVKILERID